MSHTAFVEQASPEQYAKALNPQTKPALERRDITSEEWRQYSWIDPATGHRMVYKIHNPVAVYLYVGCKTHRVLDEKGVAHCLPSVGMYGCVLTWKNKPGYPPVTF
jgi:hypothetical protein